MQQKINKYPFNEYFFSTQGEGFHIGKLALFFRFGRCNLRCKFCDTKAALDKYTFLTLQKIKNILKKYISKTNYLILTGGEPLLYDLKEIIKYAKKLKYVIAVETNGTLYQDWLKNIDWLTVSPKKQGEINKKVLKMADELKFVIQKKSDFTFVEQFMPFFPTFLMPVDNNIKIAELILNYIKKNKSTNCIRLGIQMHKVYNIK